MLFYYNGKLITEIMLSTDPGYLCATGERDRRSVNMLVAISAFLI